MGPLIRTLLIRPDRFWTHVHGSEDGELQQRSRESVSQSEDEGRLLSEQLLHGVLQAQVQSTITLHKVRQAAAGLQELLDLVEQVDHIMQGSKFMTEQDRLQGLHWCGLTCRCTTPCQQRAMPAMLLLVFTLGLDEDEEDEEEAAEESLFLPSLPSRRQTAKGC